MTKSVERIFLLMNEHGISQKKMAEILGTSPSVLSDWKSDKRTLNPSYKQIKKIATHFNVTTDYLLGQTDEKAAPRGEQSEAKWQQLVKQFDDETLETARVFAGLSVEDRARMLDYLALLKNRDSS
jgi:transcriptional regulator with XRE-family HTH domain